MWRPRRVYRQGRSAIKRGVDCASAASFRPRQCLWKLPLIHSRDNGIGHVESRGDFVVGVGGRPGRRVSVFALDLVHAAPDQKPHQRNRRSGAQLGVNRQSKGFERLGAVADQRDRVVGQHADG